MDPLLLFLHIPKAAGSSLSSIVWRQFNTDDLFDIYGANPDERIHALQAMPQDERDRLHCVLGHFPYGLHTHFTRPARYITMLRDPVKRVISGYHYIHHRPDNWLYREVVGKRMSLDQFVADDGLASIASRNLQTRLICGDRSKAPITEAMYERAEANLRNQFLAVGVTEQFDEFLLLLHAVLGWNNLLYLKKNVGASLHERQAPSPETIERIREANAFDVRLHAVARQLFAAQFKKTVRAPRLSLWLFRRLCAAYAARCRVARRRPKS